MTGQMPQQKSTLKHQDSGRSRGLLSVVRRFISARPLAFLAIVMIAGAAAAAVTITYTNPSTVTTGVTAAPVQFRAGDDAGPSTLTDYVSAYAISTNSTYLSTTVNGVPEATLGVSSFFKLTNVDDASHTVTLSTPQVANAYVTTYELRIYDGTDTLLGTLDLRAANPTATVTIPAGQTVYATLDLTLDSGAGSDNVALTNAVSLSLA